MNGTARVGLLTDMVARAVAIAACAAFWWIWLTVDLTVVLAIAGSTKKLDVSPSVVVAVLALLTIVLLIGGLLLVQPIFARAHAAAMALTAFLERHHRAIAASIRDVSILLLKTILVVAAVVAAVGIYVQALAWAMTLMVMTADQLDSMPVELGPDAITPWLAAFGRMYVAIGLLSTCLALPYVLVKRGMPRPRAPASAWRGSLDV